MIIFPQDRKIKNQFYLNTEQLLITYYRKIIFIKKILIYTKNIDI